MKSSKIVRVGSRDSALAVVQAELVMNAVRRIHPAIRFELVAMKTSGDRMLDAPLDAVGGKGLFIKELDEALLDGRVDFCVHSYKDMPAPADPRLPVVAVGSREDPRDALVLPEGADGPDFGVCAGTSSRRRRLQLASLYPRWKSAPVRGNILTRLRKLDAGEFGGLVLAAAGIKRLRLQERIFRIFTVDEMIPAACQGALAVQGRAGEDYGCLSGYNDNDAHAACAAERAFIEALGGGCSSPNAAYAEVRGGELLLRGLYLDAGGRVLKARLAGPREFPESLGKKLAARLLAGDGHEG